MAEAFRSGLDNVESIQIQSALSLGMKKSQAFRYVILPQAVSNSIPAFCANIIFLIKETSVFSAVALADLMFITKDLIGIYYKTDEALFMLVIACLLYTSTGSTITKDQLQEWVDYANKVGAVIIYDAAYEAYISEDDVPHSIYECEGARTCAIEDVYKRQQQDRQEKRLTL